MVIPFAAIHRPFCILDLRMDVETSLGNSNILKMPSGLWLLLSRGYDSANRLEFDAAFQLPLNYLSKHKQPAVTYLHHILPSHPLSEQNTFNQPFTHGISISIPKHLE
jgi:hypothetical protein